MFVNLKDVLVDQKYQSRMAMDDALVTAYAELMHDGVKFPPVRIVHVEDQYVLVDGFHRLHATEKIGEYEIEAEVVVGTWRDVTLFKWQSNATHGKPLTREEKRRLIREMLADEECSLWTNRKLGKFLGVSHTLVNTLRTEQSAELVQSGNISTPATKSEAQAADVKPAQADGSKKSQEPANANSQEPANANFEESSEQQVMIETLIDENDRLTKQLAVSVLPEAEQAMAGQLIDDLRAEVKLLKVELESVKASRDRYQWENAELKKQVAAQQKQLKKQAAA